MIPDRLLPLEVVWQQPGTTTDEYNNQVLDWTSPTSNTIRAYIEQQSTNEIVDGRDLTSTRLLFVTNELGVESTHRIVWDGVVYAVDGDAFVYQTPNGPHHLEASLLLVDAVNPQGVSA